MSYASIALVSVSLILAVTSFSGLVVNETVHTVGSTMISAPIQSPKARSAAINTLPFLVLYH
jgi:hypothetical protein